jgi:DNA-binding GntR family transcriptional regulator
VGAQPGLVDLSDQAIADMYEARDVVETEVERRAVPLLGDAGLADLHVALDAQRRAIADRDSAAMLAGNRAFHFAIFERCPNPRLTDLVLRLWDVMDPYRVISYGRMWDGVQDELMGDEILVEHSRIVDALDRGGRERALHLLRRHRGRSQAFVETKLGSCSSAG